MNNKASKIIVVLATEVRDEDGKFPNFEKDKQSDRRIYVGGEVRMQAAIKAAQDYPEAKFIMLGGWAEKNRELISKPDDMANFLKEKVPNCHIETINSLPSTRSNLVALFNTLGDQLKENEVTILTNDYHEERIKAIWDKLRQDEYAGIKDPEFLTVSKLGLEEEVCKDDDEYKLRVQREAEGVAALNKGEYSESKRVSVESILKQYPEYAEIILTPKERELYFEGIKESSLGAKRI